MKPLVLIPLLGAALAFSSPVLAERLTYSPINPSFGGNPMNSSHLMGLASAQRTATIRGGGASGAGGGSGTGTTPGSTDADLFVRQLQGRLLSALASQVTDAIFGTNPQDSGTIQFGDTTVTFDRTLGSITLIIDDGFGGVTEIVVPQLISSGAAVPANNMTAAPLAATPASTSLSGSLSGGSLSSNSGF